MDASLRTGRVKGQPKEEVMTYELLAIDLGKLSFHLHSTASLQMEPFFPAKSAGRSWPRL
ncbi:hypothetical protein AGR4A_pTi0159 [Agrobacterium tumefaciens str. B6]|uniref:Uncharacterized protein n=1 Tax=Agrobacterium tumefaciens str. B6 TaxID=1183423 RepID=A0A822VDB9_AGRTU|nr:hypothetical protein AGR4A_pTi0159 [Agrobacterium tumefaciens str. B6]